MGAAFKAKIIVTLDEPSADPFDSTKRRCIAALSTELIECRWKYKPSSGGMVDATIKARVKRGTALRKRLETGHVGLVSIYRSNHAVTLPEAAGYAQPHNDYATNEKSYLLFQGMAENPSSKEESDVFEMKVRGLGKWLDDVEYTGTFTDESVGDIFETVMTEVLTRDNIPFGSKSVDDMGTTGTAPNVVPDSRHALHTTLVGEREYKDAAVSKILKDLQEAAGGKSVCCWGVRCGDSSDDGAEVYFETWSNNFWTPEFQLDEDDLEQTTHIPKSQVTKLGWKVDTSNIKNSVTVYGGLTPDEKSNYYGSSEVGVSVEEHGRRHATVVNEDLPSEEACLEYAAAWLQENSGRKVSVEVEFLDPMTLKSDARVGAATAHVPNDVVSFLRDMSKGVRVLAEDGDPLRVLGSQSDEKGIDALPVAVHLTGVGSGDPPHIHIDTTAAPFPAVAWSASLVFGHPNKKLEYGTGGNQYGTERSLLYAIRFAPEDYATQDLNNIVLWECEKKLRLRISQSGGANTSYGFCLDSWRGSVTGWVDEFAESPAFGVWEGVPASTWWSLGGLSVFVEIQGNISTYPSVGLWTSLASPWRTMLNSVNQSQLLWGSATSHLAYADIDSGQTEDVIRLGCGTQSDGTSLQRQTGGSIEINGFRVYEGLLNNTTGLFEYGGHAWNAEGVTDVGTGAYDAASSHLGLVASEWCPRSFSEDSCLLDFEPAITKTTDDGSERYHVRFSRASLGTYVSGSRDGFHAKLVDPQDGDGAVSGVDAFSNGGLLDATVSTAEYQYRRSRPWRLGVSGDFARKLGDGIWILPASVEFLYGGEYSPLKVKMKGGTVSESISGATDAMTERITQAERKGTETL